MARESACWLSSEYGMCPSRFALCIFLGSWNFLLFGGTTVGNVAPVAAEASCPLSVTLPNETVISFAQCTDLRNQGSTLSWSFQPSNSNSLGRILDVAFRSRLTSANGWVGWGINLERADSMVGTSALVAFSALNGSNVLPYKLTSALLVSSEPLVCSPIDIEVLSSGVEILSSLDITMFATIRLPANLTVINQVWNRGGDVSDFSPSRHFFSPEALSTFGTLNLSSGVVTAGTVANLDLKNSHGVVNVVGWGILIPLGILAARYIRPFTKSTWFYVHAPIQLIGFIIGVSGFGTGLKLQEESGNIRHTHRNIGIAMFVFATVQIIAIVFRPKPDHEHRLKWNVFHHGFGYLIIILSLVNIFKGFDILAPDEKYKHAYIGLLAAFGAIVVTLEVMTWVIWFRNRSKTRSERLEAGRYAGNGQGDLKDRRLDEQL